MRPPWRRTVVVKEQLSPIARMIVLDALGKVMDGLHRSARGEVPEKSAHFREAADFVAELRAEVKLP